MRQLAFACLFVCWAKQTNCRDVSVATPPQDVGSDTDVGGSPTDAVGTVVFNNSMFPACCSTPYPGQPCFFRIPVVLAIPNTSVVLAFAEMRGGAAGWGCSDGAGPAVAFKRSVDNGASFGPLQYIAKDTDPLHNALRDGVVLGSTLYSHGTSFLFYTSCYHKCTATQSYVIRSTDGGLTWSDPATGNLTQMFASKPWQMLQFGEGLGVVLPDRLLTCGWVGQTLAKAGGHFGHAGVQCIKSIDGGASWVLAGYLPSSSKFEPEEPAIAVLPNGSILLNLRDALRSHRRWEALSSDSGDTFSPPWETAVIGPTSNAAMASLASGRVILANPRSTTARANLSLYSLNPHALGTAAEWTYLRTITSKGSAYVTSTRVADPSRIGLLFETGPIGVYESINYLATSAIP